MSDALTTRLEEHTAGRVLTPADAAEYDRHRGGFNLTLDHRPALVLAAEAESDVAAGIRFAAEHGLGVDVQATGHGAHDSMDGGLLITTRRLNRVEVDADRRVARVSAGATAAAVLAATARYGLTAPVGSASGVGYVSYSLGGGLGPFGRRHGYAADHVRRLDVVTADGRELTVTRDRHPELFRGLRGGGGNFAAVTALEVALLPFADLYGGGLFFAGERAPEVLDRFRRCVATAPRELSLSVAFLAFPDSAGVPPPLRGRFCCHVRVAYVGDPAAGRRRIEPLMTAQPFLDTVRLMPATALGTIHADPAEPMPVTSDSVALRTEDVVGKIAPLVDPGASFLLELRHLGGALADEPAVAGAVGHRGARMNLFTSAYPGVDPAASAAAQRQIRESVAAESAGGPLRTFLPTGYRDASSCYEPALAAELAALKRTWDPADTFRFAPAVSGG
ncbi:FAD-binding oxidoreductase [Amycolatopsis sp. NPDC051903]|uniref:FAD-binding oxidoreductase n=1 Tax=Amycolatopsis sp. NPDC051903 TaxID=3363936 RepID=UPI0037A37871